MTKPPLGISARVYVTRILDGDTLDVELRIPARVRLLDCWSPESRTKDQEEKRKGLAATHNLKKLAEGKYGQVFIPTGAAKRVGDVLTLDRILGRVWIDGAEQDLSALQVAGGFASEDKP